MSFPILTSLSQPQEPVIPQPWRDEKSRLPIRPVGFLDSICGGVERLVRLRAVPITDLEPHLGKPATPPNAGVMCTPKSLAC